MEAYVAPVHADTPEAAAEWSNTPL
jgi:hypothetical protein